MQKVVIIGSGGFGREVMDVINDINATTSKYEVLGFIDDNPVLKGKIINGYPVLGGLEYFDQVDPEKISAICAIGNAAVRQQVILRAKRKKIKFFSLVHPNVVSTKFITVGEGTIITAGCILTNQIKIGNHVIINLGVTIGHDVIIEDFVTIAPGAHISGNVHINAGCEIGTGVVIIEEITIGRRSIIGAGGVVVKDIPSDVTAAGVPARVVKENKERIA